jgi:hypothetical protein
VGDIQTSLLATASQRAAGLLHCGSQKCAPKSLLSMHPGHSRYQVYLAIPVFGFIWFQATETNILFSKLLATIKMAKLGGKVTKCKLIPSLVTTQAVEWSQGSSCVAVI